MAGKFCAVSDAASRGGAFVDDGDGKIGGAAQKMCGEHRTAEAAADDYYIERGIAQMTPFLKENRVRPFLDRVGRAGFWSNRKAKSVTSVQF